MNFVSETKSSSTQSHSASCYWKKKTHRNLRLDIIGFLAGITCSYQKTLKKQQQQKKTDQ